jgi:hypothetical protein
MQWRNANQPALTDQGHLALVSGQRITAKPFVRSSHRANGFFHAGLNAQASRLTSFSLDEPTPATGTLMNRVAYALPQQFLFQQTK